MICFDLIVQIHLFQAVTQFCLITKFPLKLSKKSFPGPMSTISIKLLDICDLTGLISWHYKKPVIFLMLEPSISMK